MGSDELAARVPTGDGPKRGRRRAGLVAALLAVGVVAGACSSSGSSNGSGGNASPSSTTAGGGAAKADLVDSRAVRGPADDTGTPQDGGTLIWGLEAEPDGLDPSRSAFDASGQFIASAVFDPLTVLDADGKPVPYLAEKVEPSPDFKTWTIVLRSGVTFHDGSKLDAEALKINFDYWTQSFITAPSLSSVDSYEVTGPLELTVKMNQPWTSFPYVLSTQTGYVAAPSFLQNPDPNGPSMQPIGTGPFKYKEYVKGTSFSATRNADYWQKDKGLPHLDQITFRFLPDAVSRLDALENGDIDALHAYQATVVQKAREAAAAGELKAIENGDGEEDVISINTEKAPFDDIVARQAIAYATDAAKWRDKAEDHGEAHEVRGPFGPGQLGFSTDDAYPAFDLAKAKEKAAEYEKTHGTPIKATVLTTQNVDDQELMQLLIDQWKQAGIEVTVETAPLSGLVFRTVAGDYQLVGWRNFGSRDPDGDYLWWHSSGVLEPPRISTNVARYKDAKIDAALDEARGSTDPAVRQKAYETVAKQLNEGVAYIWLGRPTWVIAANPRVQGLAAAVNGSGATLGAKPWLAQLWIKR